jgi:hypothetical protein
MSLEGLGKGFKGDSADLCAEQFPLVSMGGRADRQACADRERGTPSAQAEISFISFFLSVPHTFLLEGIFFYKKNKILG